MTRPALADTRAWALEHLAELLSLAQLAGRAAMSERSFLRRFVEETGTTPLQWLVGARLGLAPTAYRRAFSRNAAG